MSDSIAKYGPAPLADTEKRVTVTLSVSNKHYPRLRRLRAAFLHQEAHEPSPEELETLIKRLAYQAIDAYCEASERDEEATIV